MMTKDGNELELAFGALHKLPRDGRRRLLTIEKIDGIPVHESIYYELLKQCGFISDYRGLVGDIRSEV